MKTKKITNSKGNIIAYTYINRSNQPCITYLHGLRSSRNSDKSARLNQFCEQNGYSYLAVDYTGHGDSEGKAEDFRVGQCLDDVLDVIKAEHITAPLYLVGSSLGGWIAYLLSEHLGDQIKGILTCAAGVDFLPMLWNQVFDDKIRTMLKNGAVLGPNEQTKGHCFSYPMFTEAEPYLLLNRKINYTGPVVLAHGDKDEIIPYQNSLKIKDALESQDVSVHIIKDEGHLMSSYPIENTLKSIILKGKL